MIPLPEAGHLSLDWDLFAGIVQTACVAFGLLAASWLFGTQLRK